MAERVRRCQDDNSAARPPDPPLRHRRNWQRELELQEPRLIRRTPSRSSLAPCSPPSSTLRAAPRWPAAMLDRGCVRRLGEIRLGRRNGPRQPNKETYLLQTNRNERGPFCMPIGGPVPVPIDTMLAVKRWMLILAALDLAKRVGVLAPIK